jgi:CRP-like cAMP-binding protein
MNPQRTIDCEVDRTFAFVSYSHKNVQLKQELSLHLRVLQHVGIIDTWDDRRIEAGSDWARQIDEAIARSKVGILLVSAHFLTSRFILHEEVPRLLRRLNEGKLRVMPIILEACLWKSVPWLAALQTRPRSGMPLNTQSGPARAQEWTDICEEIAGWLRAEQSQVGRPSGPIIPGPSDTRSPNDLADGKTTEENPAATAERTSKAAGITVRQLAEAAADNPQVEHVLASFKVEFAAASRSIEGLTDYKEMHDELHNFEFQCFPRLLAVQGLTNDLALEELERCIFDLEATINHLRAIEDRAKLSPDKTSWIGTLTQALQALQLARDTRSSVGVRKACSLLNRVLNTEPSKINDRMCRIAEELDLGPLSRALTYAEERIHELAFPPKRVDELKAGIKSLKLLETAMHELVGEHDAWQRLETDLRLIENSLARGLEELDLLWSDIERDTKQLIQAHQDLWARQLAEEMSRLTQALNATTCDRAPQSIARFRQFRRRAGQRFFQVDANLRDSFGKIADVGEPLLLLLRTIAQPL